MKKITKSFAVLLFMVIALLSFSITVSATDVSEAQNGLIATITTAKDNYKSNEDIEVTFKVTNTNDFAVDNVSIEALIPNGLKLKNQSDTKKDTVSLSANESLELSLVLVKDTLTVVVEPTSLVQPTSQVNQNTVTNNANTTDGNSGNAVATGINVPYLLVGLICLVCLIIVIVAFRFKKKAVKYLALILCLCISATSIAVVGIPNASAEETTQQTSSSEETTKQMSFDVSKNLAVDNKKYEMNAIVTYSKNIQTTENDNPVSRAELIDMLVKAYSMEAWDNVDIPYTDIKGHKYEKSIAAAYCHGLLFNNKDKFNPDENATRDFAAYVLNQRLGYVYFEGVVTCDDVDSIENKEDALELVRRGYFELIDNKFMPDRAVTVSEMNKFSELIEDEIAYIESLKTKANGNHENVIDLQDNVLIFYDNVIKSVDGNNLILVLNDETSALEEGSLFCAPNPEEDNCIEAYKVQSIDKYEDEIKITVTKPEMYEVFGNVDVTGSAKANISQSEPLVSGISKIENVSRSIKGIDWNGTSTPIKETNKRFNNLFNSHYHYDDNIKIDEAKLQLKGTYTIPTKNSKITVKLDGGLRSPELEYAIDFTVSPFNAPLYIKDDYNIYVSLKNQLYFDGTAEIVSNFGEKGELELVRVPFQPVPGVKIDIILKLVVTAEGKITINYFIDNTVGFTANKNGINLIQDFDKPECNIKAQVKLTLGIRPEIELSMIGYKLISFNATVGGKGNAEIKNLKDNKLHSDFSAYLFLDIGYNTDGLLKSVLKKFNADSGKLEIFKESNSPAKIKKHYENSTETKDAKCTYRYVKGEIKSNDFPVSGAEISVYNGNTLISVENNLTNDFGKFEFLIPAPDNNTSYPDELTFKIKKDGYESIEKTVKVKTGEDTELGTIEMKKVDNSGGSIEEDSTKNEKCGDNLTWLIKDDGTLLISGTGDMYNYDGIHEAPWYIRHVEIKSIVLENGVTSIGDYAFLGCDTTTNVSIPDSITSVGNSSFMCCNSIKRIDIPNSVTHIGHWAFAYCRSLKWIIISDNVKDIDSHTFTNCTNLVSVKLGYNVESIGNNAFSECDSLESIIIPYGVTTIGNQAFYGCDNLSYIRVPSSVSNIGENAFTNIDNVYELAVYKNTYAYQYAMNNKLVCSYGNEPNSVNICNGNISSDNYHAVVSSINLNIGESYNFEAIAKLINQNNGYYGSYADFSWSISNSNVAYITDNIGIARRISNYKASIEAKNKGTTKLTVKTSNGKTAICTVIVN